MSFKDFIQKSSVATASTTDLEEELLKRQSSHNIFPLEIFHPAVRPFIEELHHKYDIPRSYIGLCMFITYSSAIGTAYQVSRNGSDRMCLSTWGCMVGISSSGKSLALDECLLPLKEIQKDFDQEWHQNTDKLTDEKRERIDMKTVIYRDAYIPTLIRYIMPKNPKGVLKESDEILEWINGLNALGRGKESTDEQFWLSAWDGRDYTAVRSGNNKINIPRVFTNIVGGVQPKLLWKLFKNDRDQSGFIFRLLFAIPEHFRIARPVPGYSIAKEIREIHYKHVRTLYDKLPVNSGFEDGKICQPTKEAIDFFTKWEDDKIRSINAIEDINLMGIYSGILGKMKAYAWRFAGLLAITDSCFDIDSPWFSAVDQTITKDVMMRAIKAADYFYQSAIDVYDAVDNSITAPLEVIQCSVLLRNRQSVDQIAKVMKYPKTTMHRKIKQWIKDYPKVFGAITK